MSARPDTAEDVAKALAWISGGDLDSFDEETSDSYRFRAHRAIEADRKALANAGYVIMSRTEVARLSATGNEKALALVNDYLANVVDHARERDRFMAVRHALLGFSTTEEQS